MRRRVTALVGLLALTGLITGCGGRNEGGFHPRDGTDGGTVVPSPGGSSTAPGAASSSGSAGSAAATTPEGSALAQYRRFQQSVEAAYASNDASGLPSVATGPVLSKATEEIRKNRTAGVFYRFHNILNPKVARIHGTKAYVVDCMRALDHYKFDAETGRRIADYAPKGFTRYIAVLRSVDATWKVAEADGMDVQKC